MAGRVLSGAEVLALVPQQEPFRFIDEILEIGDEGVRSTYRFRPDHDFYRGHFPARPITPGVILIEAMAQAGVVAHGIWLLAKDLGPEALAKVLTIFAEANVEFTGPVLPGDRVVVQSKKVFFRRRKLRAEVQMSREDGTVVCAGTLAGMGIES